VEEEFWFAGFRRSDFLVALWDMWIMLSETTPAQILSLSSWGSLRRGDEDCFEHAILCSLSSIA
jgi:hypothetical protein